jgi:hypothetical protein
VHPDDGGSTYLWNVGRQLFYTALHPRRQIWTSYSPPWELEISLPVLVCNCLDELFTRLYELPPRVWALSCWQASTEELLIPLPPPPLRILGSPKFQCCVQKIIFGEMNPAHTDKLLCRYPTCKRKETDRGWKKVLEVKHKVIQKGKKTWC